MIFRDYTLIAGEVSNRLTVDSRELGADAMEFCRSAREVAVTAPPPGPKDGRLVLTVGMDPPFEICHGRFPRLPESAGDPLCFSIREPGRDAFQYNALIHSDSGEETAHFALVNVLGVSLAQGNILGQNVELCRNPTIEWMQEMVESLMAERPILVSCVLPTYPVSGELVAVTADFSKCYAAAWLEGAR